MILKTSHTNIDTGRTEYSMYDNITTAYIGYDPKEKCKIVTVSFKGIDDACTFRIGEKAFLCNDDGKTIEAIYPEITAD